MIKSSLIQGLLGQLTAGLVLLTSCLTFSAPAAENKKNQYMVILSGDIGQFNISNLVGHTPYSNGFKARAGLPGAVEGMKTKFLPSIEYA
ncbi:hypothetical protein A1359_03860 [Methylomonas lenta]|uniref:Uncharacterized protein n=1 Tax=Methylomonas lenta TaxID=980561 RepID=A0A177NN10_9GAMM|nr:hypothetical protein [Methylomonas lenta]OAI19437.1 hypothetical protein A1359_03860 [Methylomonas lenta]